VNKGLLAIIFLLACTDLRAMDSITPDQLALEVVYLALHIEDWQATRYIADNPDRYWEAANPFLTRHPSKRRVDAWFIGAGIIQVAGFLGLRSAYRYPWLALSIGVESCMVRKNVGVGIKVKI
jgi:hypothetical protein